MDQTVNCSFRLFASGGFEIYLKKDYANFLWDVIWDVGQSYQIAPGCPNLIERIEGAFFLMAMK